MPAIITLGTRVLNAEQLLAGFSDASTDKYYLFIGKSTEWDSDILPPVPTDSIKSNTEARRDMLSMQRISESDVSLGILRRDWTLGRYYDMYRHDYGNAGVTGVNMVDGTETIPGNIDESNFYVVTDEFNVYMCVWNGGGLPSTVKPTGKSTSIIATADGYNWKYMYTVPSADVLKFSSTNFVPVRKVETNPGVSSPYYDQWEVRSAAVPGTINRAIVRTAGSGYAPSTSFPVTIIGDGIDCAATAFTNGSGGVSSITITNIGTGYTWAEVSIPGGIGAAIDLIISPKGGFGFDSVDQLNAHYMLIGVQLPHAGPDFPETNEYRRIGVIRSPSNFGSSTIATAATLNANRILNMNLGVSGIYSEDEIVTGATSGATGTVVSFGSSNLRIIQIGTQRGTFLVGETVTGVSSSATGTIAAITAPEVDSRTGEIVYLEHRRPIYRQEDQIEVVKVIIES